MHGKITGRIMNSCNWSRLIDIGVMNYSILVLWQCVKGLIKVGLALVGIDLT